MSTEPGQPQPNGATIGNADTPVVVPQIVPPTPVSALKPLAAPSREKLTIDFGHGARTAAAEAAAKAAKASAQPAAPTGPDYSIGLPDETWLFMKVAKEKKNKTPGFLTGIYERARSAVVDDKEVVCVHAVRQQSGLWQIKQLGKDKLTGEYTALKYDYGQQWTEYMVSCLSAFSHANPDMPENQGDDAFLFANWVAGYNQNAPRKISEEEVARRAQEAKDMAAIAKQIGLDVNSNTPA